MPGIGVRGEGRYVLSRIGTSTTVVLGQEPTKPATIPMPPAMPPATPPLPFDTGNESKDIDNTARTPAIAHENITICLPDRPPLCSNPQHIADRRRHTCVPSNLEGDTDDDTSRSIGK